MRFLSIKDGVALVLPEGSPVIAGSLPRASLPRRREEPEAVSGRGLAPPFCVAGVKVKRSLLTSSNFSNVLSGCEHWGQRAVQFVIAEHPRLKRSGVVRSERSGIAPTAVNCQVPIQARCPQYVVEVSSSGNYLLRQRHLGRSNR